MRTHLLMLAGGALAIALAAWAPVQAQSGRLSVGRPTLRPNRLPGTGGSVFVKVKVSKSGGSVSQVQAQAQYGSNYRGARVSLTRGGNNTWSGNVAVPRNPQRVNGSAVIAIYVTSNTGAEPERLLNPRIQVGPGDDTLPPPPPSN